MPKFKKLTKEKLYEDVTNVLRPSNVTNVTPTQIDRSSTLKLLTKTIEEKK